MVSQIILAAHSPGIIMDGWEPQPYRFLCDN